MNAIVNGKIVTPGAVLEDRALLYDTKVRGIVSAGDIPRGTAVLDAASGYILPGFVDMHIHGYMGEDASDGSPEGLRIMAEGVAQNGVTAFLPTTMTVSRGELQAAFTQIRKAAEDSKTDAWQGARVMGANAEGPFINPAKKGAQSGAHILRGDAAFLKEYADIIRVFTIAPEMEGNLNCIREMSGEGMLISIGHTAASYEQTCAGIEAGVRHATHLFNAMTPLMHRDPGVVGAVLSDKRVSCELIADTFHVHKGLFQLIADIKGDQLVLITDCTRAGGLKDGEYTLGGQPIFVKGIECRLRDGTIAGSVLKLNAAVRNMMDNTDLPMPAVVRMASLTPARLIGAADRIGSLEEGKDADIVLTDDRINIVKTIVGGRTVYQA